MDEGRLEKDIVLVIGITKTEKKRDKKKRNPSLFLALFQSRKKGRKRDLKRIENMIPMLQTYG